MKRALENPSKDKPLVLCKNIALAYEGNFEYLPSKSSNYQHIFLLRHPIKVLLSWRNLMYQMATTFLKQQSGNVASFEEFHFLRDGPKNFVRPGFLIDELYDVWTHVRENIDPNPIVIDSDDLLSDPAGILSKLCSTVGLPYSNGLLKWEADPAYTDDWRCIFRPIRYFELSRVASHNAFHSTEFQRPKRLPSMDELSDDVREGVEAVMPYYNEMYSHRIRP